MKNVPQRTCVACRTKKDKKELLRIVCNKEKQINIDVDEKMPGRGAYICKSKECIEKAIKNKSFEREFKIKIEDEFYLNLRGVVIE